MNFNDFFYFDSNDHGITFTLGTKYSAGIDINNNNQSFIIKKKDNIPNYIKFKIVPRSSILKKGYICNFIETSDSLEFYENEENIKKFNFNGPYLQLLIYKELNEDQKSLNFEDFSRPFSSSNMDNDNKKNKITKGINIIDLGVKLDDTFNSNHFIYFKSLKDEYYIHGIIDSDYRGIIKLIINNLRDCDDKIEYKKDYIFEEYEYIRLQDNLNVKREIRGSGGFGSTN